MTDQLMTPAEAAEVWSIPMRGDVVNAWGVEAIKVLRDHARATAAPEGGDLAALDEVKQALGLAAVHVRHADKKIRSHRCSPASEAATVSGREAALLPEGSVFVACGEDGMPFSGAPVLVVGKYGPGREPKRCRVLHRAPDPVHPLTVGDTVETADDMDRLPVGSIVRDDGGLAGQRVDNGWLWVDPVQNEIGAYGKATVVYLPDGAS